MPCELRNQGRQQRLGLCRHNSARKNKKKSLHSVPSAPRILWPCGECALKLTTKMDGQEAKATVFTGVSKRWDEHRRYHWGQFIANDGGCSWYSLEEWLSYLMSTEL